MDRLQRFNKVYKCMMFTVSYKYLIYAEPTPIPMALG